MIDIILVMVSFFIILFIILYASWLFIFRIRNKESLNKSFREWLKNIFEAIWGL